MKNILFTGRIKANSLKKELTNHHSITTIIAEQESQQDEFQNVFPSSRVYYRFDIATISNTFPTTVLHENHEGILRKILSDPRTYYLCERTHSSYGLRSLFNNTVLIENTIWNAIYVIHESGASQVVFQATPHSLATWLFGRTAELLDLQVFFAAPSSIPWRIEVLEGIDTQRPLYPPTTAILERITDATSDLIKKKQRTYDVAIPSYEKKRQDSFKGKHWNTLHEIKSCFAHGIARSPFMLLQTIRKYRALKKYTQLTSRFSMPKTRYCVFFLHYQPERTTLPEGGWYSHQWLAIRSLSTALDHVGARLVVKEHPSMFYQPWNGTFRDYRFYDAINMLPNAVLAPLSLSPFELIDSATCSASINGTVMYESLIRNKPVVAFGFHVPENLNGLFKVHDAKQTRSAVEKIFKNEIPPERDSIYDYFLDLENRTFQKEDDINTSTKAIAYLVDRACEQSC